MFGFVYLGWALISHIGYKTKELFYNALAPVDKHTNTYWGYDGHEYVAGTNKRVCWFKESNGDEVLYDRPGHVYRNLSAEKREREYEELQNNRNGATAYKTGERRLIKYHNPITQNIDQQYGTIYWDLDTKEEYVCVDCLVDMDEKKEFYALVNNPYKVVRISDRQRKTEIRLKKHYLVNWIDCPSKERNFIEKHNSKVPVAGIITLKT